ncbi:hypothetical protein [Pedobacter sp. UBA4863]|uniref:hypothetical protein n=1 Tax=Pedobacter sp. UBA4863 TaxID=1947060 RepID=UPI0025DCD2EA|nr:hypothetical protein [Pedobacter sp. UBA4863]
MGVFDKIKGTRITDTNLINEIMGTNPTSPHSLKDKKYYHFYGELIEGVHPQKGTV